MTLLENALNEQDQESLPVASQAVSQAPQDDKSVFGSAHAQCLAVPGYAAQPTFPFALPQLVWSIAQPSNSLAHGVVPDSTGL